ncbi:glycine/betaine/sarcosine/D-proline family reductase selenoprotein B [Hespellia stercorisuis]|uniref:Selenoprotein B, glycine/betaine/sarcosine/D-proline reductase family n=1 Tax=Hespellia stercorisuis DSM 15480 TaxID=1121950 RepID=A0A1M6M4K7_9FIRM|nr:glycine/betaine/sarcosine/D-proline family reductase selenoprotein B [Hespellia stercorisuis]SHJ78346.1 selenoprotein B, glycine/betaine/sarcosine/D-proline reductase family [Hespellia stercorisuis DSM 15480]
MINPGELIYSNPDSKPLKQGNKVIPFINYQAPAPQRCLDMLLAKYYNKPYQSEVMMYACDTVSIPKLKCKLSTANLLLVTDGGLVPFHNPDRIPSTCANRFGVYSIKGKNSLGPRKYEISHQGYDNSFVEQNPNRLLPVDALRELEMNRVIGKLHDTFISTTGVMMPASQSKLMGKKIAEYVAKCNVDAVLLVSACGTSTRCGAYIGLAIEKIGIPVVQVTNLTQIALDTGLTRVVKGNNICYPFGKPSCSLRDEYAFRRQLVLKALYKLQKHDPV